MAFPSSSLLSTLQITPSAALSFFPATATTSATTVLESEASEEPYAETSHHVANESPVPTFTSYGEHHDTPISYPFTPTTFNLALTTAIVFFILSLLHTLFCIKKKTVFFAITIYASLAMTTAQILKCYLVGLQNSLLDPNAFDSPAVFDRLEQAGIITIVMELLEAVPASAMGFLLMMTYTRLTWFVVAKPGRKNGRVFGLPVRWQTSILALGQMVGDGLVGVGHYYGIDALQSFGGVIGIMTWGLLGGLVVRLGRVKIAEEERRGVKKLVWAVGGSVGLLLVCGITRIIRREQVAYLLSDVPWISLEDDDTNFYALEEWPVYVFQHLPIVVILVLLAVYHPGDYLPKRLTGWRLKTKRLLREERMREDVENLKVLSRQGSKSSSVESGELDCFERVDLDKETK